MVGLTWFHHHHPIKRLPLPHGPGQVLCQLWPHNPTDYISDMSIFTVYTCVSILCHSLQGLNEATDSQSKFNSDSFLTLKSKLGSTIVLFLDP